MTLSFGIVPISGNGVTIQTVGTLYKHLNSIMNATDIHDHVCFQIVLRTRDHEANSFDVFVWIGSADSEYTY